MRNVSGLLLLVLLLGAPGVVAAQGFAESTDVVVVEVPVQVLDGAGEPVRGLTADDFEIYEKGKKQKIVGFEVLDLKVEVPGGGPKTRQAPPPISARRHFLFLFDLSFSSPKAAEKSKEAARHILEKLHPSDLVAVGSYISTKGAELLLAFSGDRDQALVAIDRISKPTALDYKPDPLRLVLGPGAPQGGDGGGGGGEGEGEGAGRGGARSESLRAALGEAGADFSQGVSMSLERADRGQQERALTAMTRSLAELARMMQGVRGRKHVVLFSEGFDGSLLRGSANVDDQHETQGVRRVVEGGGLGDPVDGREGLVPVAAEGEQQLGPLGGDVGAHGHQVRRMELLQDLAGCLLGLRRRLGGGEGEVEEEQEVAARRDRRRGLARLRSAAGHFHLEVEHLEADDLLLPPALVDLEVVGREPADRLAGAVEHLHRHLDHDDVRGLGEGLGARARSAEHQAQEKKTGSKPHQNLLSIANEATLLCFSPAGPVRVTVNRYSPGASPAGGSNTALRLSAPPASRLPWRWTIRMRPVPASRPSSVRTRASACSSPGRRW